jgi:integrase
VKHGTCLCFSQAEKLFDAARETPNFRSLLVVLCTTGLRIGEALALKWSDIDFDSQSLSVKRALQRQRGRGLVFVEPKTALSRRTVHLTALACDELCRHRLRQAVDCDRAGTQWQDSDVVFASQLGSPLDPTNISHRFQRLIQAAGLPPIPLHGLRHTAATLLLQEGIHPRVVQEMLGHSTILQTLGTYSHVMPTMHRDAATKMNSLFRPMDRELD